MALNSTSSSTFADNVMVERRGEISSHEGVKVQKIRSCVSELAVSLQRIEECCRAGDGKSDMMLGLIEEVKKFQELAEVLNSFTDTVKGHACSNQLVVKEIAGYGSSAQHVPTFYTSATGSVEVVPAPEFRAAEAFSPCSRPVAVTNSALKMVKSPKKGKRPRDRKSKKPQVPLQIVKTEDDGKIPDDGYSWRKYGSKNIKTAIYKKAYYRCNAPCSKNKNRKCLAKKTVQQANNDPTVLHVAYDAPHSCTVPLNMQDCPSPDAQGSSENLNLAEQMLSSANAGLVSQAQTTEWVLMNQFSVLRTSSGNFSAVTEDEIQGGTDHDPLASLSKGCGMVNGDSLELRELTHLQSVSDMMGSGLDDWTTGLETDSPELKALQCERQYVDSGSVPDIIEEELLIARIHRQLQEPDSYFRSAIGDIHNWHSYSS